MTIDSLNYFTNPETTKEMIISILTEEFPLSLPKLKNKLSKKYLLSGNI